jgi:methyl-accepting chemotaxis protein
VRNVHSVAGAWHGDVHRTPAIQEAAAGIQEVTVNIAAVDAGAQGAGAVASGMRANTAEQAGGLRHPSCFG